MFDPVKAKNDRQISFSGGFNGRQGPVRGLKKDRIGWKIPVMMIAIGVLLLITPSLFKALAH